MKTYIRKLAKKKVSEKLRALRLPADIVGRSLLQGSFASYFLGEGYELHSTRKYTIEDDGKAIDWNVSARMNTPFVRTYHQERNINIFLCVDFSLSMHASCHGKMLQDVAKDISYIFSIFSLKHSIPLGFLFFAADNFELSSPATSKQRIFYMLEKMETCFLGYDEKREDVAKRGTPLEDALQKIETIAPTHSLIFIISDFNVAHYQHTLFALARKHDVVALRLFNDADLCLEKMGTVHFFDYESSFSTILNTSSKSYAERRKTEAENELISWKSSCLASHIHPLLLNSSSNLTKELSLFFASYKNHHKIRL